MGASPSMISRIIIFAFMFVLAVKPGWDGVSPPVLRLLTLDDVNDTPAERCCMCVERQTSKMGRGVRV